MHVPGGSDYARSLWPEYFDAVDAVVFLVDCNDRERIGEAKEELDKLLNNDKLAGVPFLVLGTKTDRPLTCLSAELRQALQLESRLTGKGEEFGDPTRNDIPRGVRPVKRSDIPGGMRPMELFMVSAFKQQSYMEGFQWLAQYIA